MLSSITGTSGLLALGGLTALVTAGWSHIRSVFQRISGLLIVKVYVRSTPLFDIIMAYLKDEYSILPFGHVNLAMETLKLKSTNRLGKVVFQIPVGNNIFYKGTTVIVVSEPNGAFSITHLRGVDLNSIIRAAVARQEEINIKNGKDHSRFMVRKRMGREKTTFSNDSTARPRDGGRDGELTEHTGQACDILRDPSITHDFEDYQVSRTDPFKALMFSDEIMSNVEKAVQWFDNADWYAKRSIPWRRGWLMHGPGGTGKSSLAKATAQRLGIPIYMFYLSTMSDQEFMEQWDSMATPCVALFEDFDAVFNLREPLTEHKSLTFDCVLNQISGVATMDGIFLMVTTNNLDAIDPAMGVSCNQGEVSTRPGRIDTVMYMGFANEATKRSIANRILVDWPEVIEDIVSKDNECTPVQFTELCIQEAFKRMPT